MKAAAWVGLVMALAACGAVRSNQPPSGTHVVRTHGTSSDAHAIAAQQCLHGYDVVGAPRNYYQHHHIGPNHVYLTRHASMAVACREPPTPPGVVPWGKGFFCTSRPGVLAPDVCTRTLLDCQTFRGAQPLTPCTHSFAASCFLIYPHKVERCSVSPAACEQYRAAEAARGTEVTICVDAK
jgi:hypothetical protein